MKCWIKNKKNPINKVKNINFDYNYWSYPVEKVIGTVLSTQYIADKFSKNKKEEK